MLDATKKRLYARQAQIVQALAHPIRLAVVDFLQDGEQCVCKIAEHVGAERSNVSRHLSVMLKGGVVQTRKEGLMVFYSLRTPCILNFLACATQALRHNAKEDAQVLAQL